MISNDSLSYENMGIDSTDNVKVANKCQSAASVSQAVWAWEREGCWFKTHLDHYMWSGWRGLLFSP